MPFHSCRLPSSGHSESLQHLLWRICDLFFSCGVMKVTRRSSFLSCLVWHWLKRVSLNLNNWTCVGCVIMQHPFIRTGYTHCIYFNSYSEASFALLQLQHFTLLSNYNCFHTKVFFHQYVSHDSLPSPVLRTTFCHTVNCNWSCHLYTAFNITLMTTKLSV